MATTTDKIQTSEFSDDPEISKLYTLLGKAYDHGANGQFPNTAARQTTMRQIAEIANQSAGVPKPAAGSAPRIKGRMEQ